MIMNFEESLMAEGIQKFDRTTQYQKDAVADTSKISGIRTGLVKLSEDINSLTGGRGSLVRSDFEKLLLDETYKEAILGAIVSPLSEDIKVLEADAAQGSLDDRIIKEEKLSLMKENMEFVMASLERSTDRMEEQHNLGEFKPYAQTILAYQYVLGIKNNAKAVIKHEVRKTPIFDIQRKKHFVEIEGVKYNLLDVKASSVLLDKMNGAVAGEIIEVADLSNGTTTTVDFFANVPDKTAATHKMTYAVRVGDVTYMDTEATPVEQTWSPKASDDASTDVARKGVLHTTFIDTDGNPLTFFLKVNFADATATVTSTDPRIKSVKLITATSVEGARDAITPTVETTQQKVALDKMLHFIISEDTLTQKLILDLTKIDVVMETTAAVSELVQASKDAEAFKLIETIYGNLNKWRTADGKAGLDFWSPNKETALIEATYDETPGVGFNPQTLDQWKDSALPKALKEISQRMQTVFNIDGAGVKCVVVGNPMTTGKIPPTGLVVSKNDSVGGVTVDYSIFNVQAGNQNLRVVSTERVSDEENMRVVPVANTPNNAPLTFAMYVEELRHDVRDIKNLQLPAKSFVSVYGTYNSFDILGNLKLIKTVRP